MKLNLEEAQFMSVLLMEVLGYLMKLIWQNDAIVVVHSALDYRRIIDVPGYERVNLHPATRFIGTMNYEYAGTKELNEALVSRFMVIDIPPIEEDKLMMILKMNFQMLMKKN